jgi:hypothetical protein
MTFPDEITMPLVPERPRRRPLHESDRWSRWADEDEQDEDRRAPGSGDGSLDALRAFPGAA